MSKSANDRIIGTGTKFAFGIGQVAEGLKNTSFGLFVLFYYSQVLEVPASLCGLILFIALLFDAVTDPLAGSLSDNWKSPHGRRHPFMYAAALPLALAFWGLFSPPDLSVTGLAIWLLVFSVLTRGAMTLYHVPHLALGAELTENFEERTSIVAFRQAFGYIGALTASALAFGYFFVESMGGRLNAASYPSFAAVLSVLMALTIWLSAYGTRREIPNLPGPSPPLPGTSYGVIDQLIHDTRAAFQNRSFRWLFGGVLIIFVMVGVNQTLDIYVFQYFWELQDSQFLLLTIATPIGLIFGTPFVRPLHTRLDKKAGLVIGSAGWATLQILPVALRLAGWFPENGDSSLVPMLVAFRFLQGMIVQQALVSFGSMMADVADEHELATGRRTEGIFFGAVAFSGKLSNGLGTFFGGIGLDLISFPRGAHIQTAADVDPGTIIGLGIIYGPVVAAFGIISVWCYTHYGLDRARHSEIISKLQERRDARANDILLDT
jgi:GPH family glycoside/pentoside/hexuronide:cation symporter